MLLVEDDPVTGSALLAILRRRGHDVTLVTTIADALKKIDDQPHIVILDLMLPDGDGITILQHIRRNQLPISVLVTSAVSEPQHLREIREWRPDLLLQKPIDLGRLLAVVQPKN